MLFSESNKAFTERYLVFIPGVTIMITVLAINLLGDGFRDAPGPRPSRLEE